MEEQYVVVYHYNRECGINYRFHYVDVVKAEHQFNSLIDYGSAPTTSFEAAEEAAEYLNAIEQEELNRQLETIED